MVLRRCVAFDKHRNAGDGSVRSCITFTRPQRPQRPQLRALCRAQKKCTMRQENLVGCLLLVVFLAFPRIILAALFLFSNYLQRAYHGLLLPLLGFLFMPLTTLAYARRVNTGAPVEGVNLLILLVVVIVDLGGIGGGAWHRSRR